MPTRGSKISTCRLPMSKFSLPTSFRHRSHHHVPRARSGSSARMAHFQQVSALHLAHSFISAVLGMDEVGKRRVQDFSKPPVLCKFDLCPTRLVLLRRIRAWTGVQKCQLRNALRGLPHDLERDISAHRQAYQDESGRCRGENPLCNGAHAIIARVIRDCHGSQPPQLRHLPRVESAVVQEAEIGPRHRGCREQPRPQDDRAPHQPGEPVDEGDVRRRRRNA